MDIPVLIYHQVTDDSDEYTITDCHCYTNNFIKQMDYLKSNGYAIITLAQAIDNFKNNINDAQPRVILTFDDAFQSFFEVVYPILNNFGFPAHLYVPVHRIGGYSSWMKKPKSQKNIMNIEQLQEVSQNNIIIGSHTLTHTKLTHLEPFHQLKELELSRKILESYLGISVSDLSYPHGDFDEKTLKFVADVGYKTAVTCNSKFFNRYDDNLAIPRIYITQQDTLEMFVSKLQGVKEGLLQIA